MIQRPGRVGTRTPMQLSAPSLKDRVNLSGGLARGIFIFNFKFGSWVFKAGTEVFFDARGRITEGTLAKDARIGDRSFLANTTIGIIYKGDSLVRRAVLTVPKLGGKPND